MASRTSPVPTGASPHRRPWHEQDAYWEAVADTVFTPQRRRNAARETADALALVRPRRGASVLDLGCGVGLHALELARRGFRVTGVDRTRSFIEAAAQRARAERLAAQFVCEDMRTFVRPGAFDVALSLYTSFGYFEDPRDERAVIANLYHSLRSGATLLIDTDGREVLERDFTSRVRREGADTVACEEREISRDHRWVRSRLTLHRRDGRTELQFQYRLYSAGELAELLRSCGFANTTVFGGLDGRAYDEHAVRLVMVSRRTAGNGGSS